MTCSNEHTCSILEFMKALFMRRKLLNFLFKILIHESSEFCLAFAEKEISKEDGVKEKVMFGEETSSQSVFYFIPINE